MREAAQHLIADGIEQSTMSVQNPDLFYWGQDRLFAVISWLASPIADPSLNLWACLTLGAGAFFALLATTARLVVTRLAGSRSWAATLITFFVLVAVARVLLRGETWYTLSLEAQPYGGSHLLALWALMLWQRRRPTAAALAVGCVVVMVGLNSAAVLALAALAAVALWAERERFVRALLWWGLLGAVCLLAQGLWMVLAQRYGGEPGPVPEPPLPYFEFRSAVLEVGWRASLDTIVAALRNPLWIGLLPLAGFAAFALPDDLRPRLRGLVAVSTLFAGCYWLLFSANVWVAMNVYSARYFAPVLFVAILLVATPLALALVGPVLRPEVAADERVGSPAHAAPGRRLRRRLLARPGVAGLVAIGVAAVAGSSFAGTLRNPNEADVLVAMQPTADYAVEHDVRFISGYYWFMWPVLHDSLDNGRDRVFIAGYKSGGEIDGYHEAFAQARAAGEGTAQALCVGWDVSQCQEYLSFWTAPGWADTGRTCPMPDPNAAAYQRGLFKTVPVPACRVLEHRDPTAPLTLAS